MLVLVGWWGYLGCKIRGAERRELGRCMRDARRFSQSLGRHATGVRPGWLSVALSVLIYLPTYLTIEGRGSPLV